VTPTLDHLVYAVPDLAAAVAWFSAATGVEPAPGGSHVGLGTANHLVGLGQSQYLEIIGPDPDQPAPDRPRPFGVDDLTGPRLVTWAVATRNVDVLIAEARSGGYDPGEARAMSRRTPTGDLLEWRLTAPDAGYGAGLVPFLIDWEATRHPTSRGLPQTPLLELRATHPDPASVRPALAALRVDLRLDIAESAALIAVVQSRNGPVLL
jgi:catechol 2,3-dioxygenase-like lactoylglutathione lyase family enzyme